MKLRKITIMAVSTLIFSSTLTLQAKATENTKPNIFINGEYRAEGILGSGVTKVPLRFISETLGAVVNWDKNTGEVTIIKGSKNVVIEKPEIISNTTYVPLRFVSENLGAEVGWDAVNRAVQITAEGVPSKEQALKDKYSALVSKAKPITSFAMKPVSEYMTMDKVPGSVNRKRYKEIAFTNDLPIQIDHSNNVLEIGTTKLKSGLEVLEVTLSVVNRDIPKAIVYPTKKTGLMLEVYNHLPGETETIIEMGDGTYIVKQKYYMPDQKLNGVTKKEIEGVGFTNIDGEYGEIVKTLVVRKKL